MRPSRWFCPLALLSALVLPATALAVTIDITVDPTNVGSLGPVTFTVGVQESGTGNSVDINGYTLDYQFDATELTFVGATQLVNFGGGPVEDFDPINDCTSGRCTAGNVPTQDAFGVLALFTLDFLVTNIVDDGIPDLFVGILDPMFNDVTQATGDPVFDYGNAVARAWVPVPEPSTAALLALGVGALSGYRRRES